MTHCMAIVCHEAHPGKVILRVAFFGVDVAAQWPKSLGDSLLLWRPSLDGYDIGDCFSVSSYPRIIS